MTQYISAISNTTPLTFNEWGVCLGIGASNLLVGFILKLTPDTWVEKFKVMSIFDEDKVVDNKILNKWNGVNTPSSSDNYKTAGEDHPENVIEDGASDKFENAP